MNPLNENRLEKSYMNEIRCPRCDNPIESDLQDDPEDTEWLCEGGLTPCGHVWEKEESVSNNENSLDGWFGVIADQGKNHEQEQIELSEKLGKPDHLDTDDEYMETGYWRCRGGLMSYQRRKCGGLWISHTRVEYLEDHIKMLANLLKIDPPSTT